PDLDFAGKGCYFAFFIDVNPRVKVVRQALIESSAARFSLSALLRDHACGRNDKDYSQSKGLDEIAAIEMKVVIRRLEQFVAFDFYFVDEGLFVDHDATSFACPDA